MHQLYGKYSTETYRISLMDCYVNWAKFKDAKILSLHILDFIGTCLGKKSDRLIPEKENNGDKSVALNIIHVMRVFVNCVATGEATTKNDYLKVLSMVKEIRPWLRYCYTTINTTTTIYNKINYFLMQH